LFFAVTSTLFAGANQALFTTTTGTDNTASGSLSKQRNTLAKQDERILQMEMALAQVLRKQSTENQVGLTD